jgi:hypothetical protein
MRRFPFLSGSTVDVFAVFHGMNEKRLGLLLGETDAIVANAKALLALLVV